MFLSGIFQQFFFFRKDGASVGRIDEFARGFVLVLIEQQNGGINGVMRLTQFLRWQFFENFNAIGGSILRIKRQRLSDGTSRFVRRLRECFFRDTLTFGHIALK